MNYIYDKSPKFFLKEGDTTAHATIINFAAIKGRYENLFNCSIENRIP